MAGRARASHPHMNYIIKTTVREAKTREDATAMAEEQAKTVFKSMAKKQLDSVDVDTGDPLNDWAEVMGEICDWLGARSIDGECYLKALFHATVAVVLVGFVYLVVVSAQAFAEQPPIPVFS